MIALPLIPLLILSTLSLGEEKGPDLAEADRLRDEGVALFEQNEYAKAALRYEEAVQAYEKALGKDAKEALERIVVLRRAICWCRAQAGEFRSLKGSFNDFLNIAFQLGGNPGEEGSVRECFEWAMNWLAKKGRLPDMEAVFRGYRAVVESFIEKAEKDGKRPEMLGPFVRRMKDSIGNAFHTCGNLYREMNQPERSREIFEEGLAYWKSKKDWEDVAWCRAKLGDFKGLKGDVEAFYKDALESGGDEEEEASLQSCIRWSLRELGVQKNEKEINTLFKAYEDVLRKTLRKAKKDRRRAKELEPFIDRTQRQEFHARQEYMEMLFVVGNTEKGLREYEKCLKFWMDRKDPEQAAWSSQNAFFEMTRFRKEDPAAFFFLETLKAVKEHRFAKIECFLNTNVRDYLAGMSRENKPGAGIRFLEAALEGAKSKDAFSIGLDEAHLRRILDSFYWASASWEKGAKNGDLTSAFRSLPPSMTPSGKGRVFDGRP
jgi:tetratricopeptide (TPR) repeat protein